MNKFLFFRVGIIAFLYCINIQAATLAEQCGKLIGDGLLKRFTQVADCW